MSVPVDRSQLFNSNFVSLFTSFERGVLRHRREFFVNISFTSVVQELFVKGGVAHTILPSLDESHPQDGFKKEGLSLHPSGFWRPGTSVSGRITRVVT